MFSLAGALHSAKWGLYESFAQIKAKAYVEADWNEPTDPAWSVNRELKFLHPLFRVEIEQLFLACQSAKLNIHPFECRRSFRRQEWLYEQGRTRLKDAQGNKLPIVTKAAPGLSFHNYGLAVDWVFDADPYKPGMQWTWQGNYEKFGEIASSFPRLEWAGDWKHFREYPHVQLKVGMSGSDLKLIYDRAGGGISGVKSLWNYINDILCLDEGSSF